MNRFSKALAIGAIVTGGNAAYAVDYSFMYPGISGSLAHLSFNDAAGGGVNFSLSLHTGVASAYTDNLSLPFLGADMPSAEVNTSPGVVGSVEVSGHAHNQGNVRPNAIAFEFPNSMQQNRLSNGETASWHVAGVTAGDFMNPQGVTRFGYLHVQSLGRSNPFGNADSIWITAIPGGPDVVPAIPEAETWVMMSIGLGMLAYIGRRGAKSSANREGATPGFA